MFTNENGGHFNSSLHGLNLQTSTEQVIFKDILAVGGELETSVFELELNGDAAYYDGKKSKNGMELGFDLGGSALEMSTTEYIKLMGIRIGFTRGSSLGSANLGGRLAGTYDSNNKEIELTGMFHWGWGPGKKFGISISNIEQEIGERKKK